MYNLGRCLSRRRIMAANLDPRITLTVDQVSVLLGVSRVSAYEGVKSGEIPSIRVGRRILVPRAALERMLAEAGQGKDSDERARV